jgi:hypothetical protein
MLVTAYHDAQGNVMALIARSDGAPPAHMELRPGRHESEVEVPELTADLDPQQIGEKLTDLMSNRRVEFDGDTARLTPKV